MQRQDNNSFNFENREEKNSTISFSVYKDKQKKDKKTLYDLAIAIYNTYSDQERMTLTSIHLKPMLEAIQESFLRTVEESKKPSHKECVMVLGVTGSGKSTFLGNQLGYPLELEKKGGRRQLDYKNNKEESLSCRPVIGHGSTMTKGAMLYTNLDTKFEYLDCAGTHDISGPEADICNSIAVTMMAKRAAPSGIIIVVDPGIFSTDRTVELIELISRIERCLKNPTSQNEWSSIYFVVNNTRSRYPLDLNEEQEEIIADIKKSIDLQEDQTKKLMLELILKNKSNIIIADLAFQADETRDAVLKALNNNKPSLTKDFFSPEHFYENKVSDSLLKFQTVLVAVASYFNKLYAQKNRLEDAGAINGEFEEIIFALTNYKEFCGLISDIISIFEFNTDINLPDISKNSLSQFIVNTKQFFSAMVTPAECYPPQNQEKSLTVNKLSDSPNSFLTGIGNSQSVKSSDPDKTFHENGKESLRI